MTSAPRQRKRIPGAEGQVFNDDQRSVFTQALNASKHRKGYKKVTLPTFKSLEKDEDSMKE